MQCVDPDPGPCLYCATSGQECKITIVRKQRPFYYASEEPSWICCLFTVLALGFSEEDLDVNHLVSPREFFSHAKRLASLAVEDESIQSIQALLLMVCPMIDSTHGQNL